ncbi:MAG TPA: biotin-dependent carboxyltransferase family protein [Gaiellaceae bacterium]|jgi:biotin-dependent carboxylase-like uncharacterized protein|nr:biotin-dependent carboxyltransferase family protein [Gaiellaceae bacterium]
MSAIDVLSPGVLTTVQDLGRPGLAHLGVSPSGAVDAPSLERGNRLVGNGRTAAALEATLIGPRLRFRCAALVAVTGPRRDERAFEVGAGDELDVGRLEHGARAYVCVRGGIDAAPVLGSRSTDLLTGLGPAPLRTGDVLALGPEPRTAPEPLALLRVDVEPVLHVHPGPRDDWFAPDAIDALVGTDWRVSPDSNRVGIRLEGPALRRVRIDELLSEGVVTGALQVPPSGLPILLLNDHPTTGGHPVLAVVTSDDLPIAGQLRPGDRVSFRR